MASCVAALSLCALFFLSTAHPDYSCPEIHEVSCERDAPYFKDWRSCRDYRFRCNDSEIEIQFGGREPPFKVVGKDTSGGRVKLEIEDPTLSSILQNTDCDFLCSFRQPWPPFTPPQRTLANSPSDLQSYCNVPDYSLLFSNVIKRYQQSPCTTYDLYYTPKELHDSQNPAPRNTCQLPGPMFTWKLSMDNHLGGTFTVVSVGFSRLHKLDRSCFNCEIKGAHCGSGSAGYGTCGKGHPHTRRKLIIGVSVATGLSMLAGILLCLWCRNKKTKTASTSSTSLFQTVSSERRLETDPEAPSETYPTHVFRYEELHEATNGFSRSNELDHGGHGTVYKGKLWDGRAIAVKRLYENSFRRAELFMNEIAILSHLRHPNLVALYGCTSRHSRELLLVYEFIPNGTIADHLHGHRAAEGALTWPVRLRIAVETATALAYLHAIDPQVIHRDVKTKNILLDRDFHVKVADFGLSRLFPVAASHVSTVPQGTPGYVDPEYHRCYQLTDKSDVYSFGVVLAELVSSKRAVDVTRSRHEINLSNMALDKIQNAALQELVDPKLGFETDWGVRRSIEQVAELVMGCLQGDRDMRPTMEGVLEELRGVEDGLHQAENGGVVAHTVGDDTGLQKNCAAASPDSVNGTWSSTTTTNASG